MIELDLPLEEDDVTATELHEAIKDLISNGLAYRLSGQALVISDIFLFAQGRQVSPDVMVRFRVSAGQRTRYIVDDEGVPEVTIEVLSPVNHTTVGLVKLQEKRDLFGAIGVAEHLEIDFTSGSVQVWEATDSGVLRSRSVGTEGVCRRLDVTFRFVEGAFEAVDADCRLFETAEAGFRRADTEAARAASYRALFERHGIDPDAEA